ncbi:ATP-binding cassette domain-containing protein [Rhodococcus rhodnii]|uniref:ABC peptide transporter n=2 Tax=Rhodococcus rhodnii TaxID=38312 RepID=R7WIE1_9NOCA|nr:ATP-binding cassette domain-containing protein [Rhodococcus rhodnii]EOM74950.1 ABC peptide transporter [Rhodococcus rhodnii LMG 5362]TXG92348.1 ATP-binding cassette domain-containing protein [Rhodococcus rhodnii]
MTGELRADGVHAGYDGTPVLRGVGVVVPPGATTALTGASGSGKTTLARVLTGLHSPARGVVTIGGRPPRRGEIAMLFQSPRRGVDPRWTLERIVGEPLLLRGVRRAQRRRAVAAAAERVALTPDLLARRPHQVSDGQLQRACLARALVQEPRYLVCDEMTSMLDPATTAFLVGVLREQAAQGTGVLAISHDHDLVAAWADTVVDLAALATTPATTTPATAGPAATSPDLPESPLPRGAMSHRARSGHTR